VFVCVFVFVDAIKAFVDTDKTSVVVSLYATLLVTWFYTRLYVFPFHFVYNTLFEAHKVDRNVSMLFHNAMNVMLCILQVLHVYWFGLFLYMGYALVSKGVQEDIQQKCSTFSTATTEATEANQQENTLEKKEIQLMYRRSKPLDGVRGSLTFVATSERKQNKSDQLVGI
jgi:hypothetical protein